MQQHNQVAPGDLEEVRRFINTWSIPNQTRVETDVLPMLVKDAHAWARELSLYPRQPADNLDMLSTLRLALRQACADHAQHPEALNAVFGGVPLQARVQPNDGVMRLQLESTQGTYAGHILAIVANAIAAGHFSRLKTCGDCQWAFYDHTRSGNKRWCGMTKGGPQGRACGTIAKVSAFRQRAAMKARAADT
ncbi:CGNR zinc finger domain-containing protein [Pseudomonas sp. LP_7_YM]|uniref:CGNR zinc finger domain-containing protein n=1 Tax=Pseudomonas sp. LP_7_YM TaxID=2485137 RepID=UPI001061FCA7|nr:CGNR zinc finger domain-containing protein [Pseudomonas sp. LP_7_YM]TDV70297.1 CGNR zinc finger protein [Pseudomonas sp. LP_7_YM]